MNKAVAARCARRILPILFAFIPIQSPTVQAQDQVATVPSQQHDSAFFNNWPEGMSPREIGTKLDEQIYGPAARRGWLALVGYIDQNADVTSVGEGTDKKNDLEYYLLRKRRTGDFHGQAPVLWATSALLR